MEKEAWKPIERKTIHTDPRSLKLLELNARYMRHEVFARLVKNIREDGVLTQYPFGWVLRDDHDPEHPAIVNEDGEMVIEILSGNHRVRGAIAADMTEIDVIYTDEYLPPNRRKAIQLSHNAISGEDDPALLKTIYESIDDIDLRIYTGLDDKTLNLMNTVDIAGLSEANLEFQLLSLTFLPDELEMVKQTFEAAQKSAPKAKGTFLVRYADYDRLLDAIEATSMASGIKNTATALLIILEVFSRHVDELTEHFLDEQGEAFDKKRRVPLQAIFGYDGVPAELAASLNKLLKKGENGKPFAHEFDLLARLVDRTLEG